LKSPFNFRSQHLVFILSGSIFFSGCAASFGPGYTIDKQDIDVHFEPGPPARISIKSNYELTNTGTRPLSVLELRLPGKRRFQAENVKVEWDGQSLSGEQSTEYPRSTVLSLPGVWTTSSHHSLHITIDLETSAEDESHLRFASDAFFLPAEGWAPELLPSRGLFATGGTPPLKWNLVVHVPRDFIVHTSGSKIKTSKHGEELTVRATQRIVDIYPYVIAGRYVTKQIGSDRQKIYLWTRHVQDPGDLRGVSDSLVKTLATYDSVFGAWSVAEVPSGFFGKHHSPSKNAPPLWLVECPVMPGCFSESANRNAGFFSENGESRSSEMVSLDTVMIDPSPGVNKLASGTAPALAATWLGYGQSPGFYEQDPPLSAFPAFAAAVGNAALEGPAARAETIRRALAMVPKNSASSKKDDDTALRAKSFLFFYALQDRYGQEVFRKAVRHILDVRRSSGFDLDDLIAAFDEESHKNTAEFVRLWMKHPGVPADFRAKYENTSADKDASSKEVTP
jgi:hypothetical protein